MADGTHPNILVIWGDDIGIANLSCYTHGLMGYQTPNIDRVAARIGKTAIGALEAPKAQPNGGADPRTPGQRRYDALMTVLRRGVAGTTGQPPLAACAR